MKPARFGVWLSFSFLTPALALALSTCAGQGQSRYAATEPSWYAASGATDQGWDYPTARWWYHVNQGTAFIPYPWLLALEQVHGEELFRSPGHMSQLGFLPSLPSEDNPDGLPVGFSRTEPQLDKPPYQCWPGEWAGLTCAACHTGEINYQGTPIRIEGGPAQIDVETFREDLALALAAIGLSPTKGERFARRVLPSSQPELGALLAMGDAAACGQPAQSPREEMACALASCRRSDLPQGEQLACALQASLTCFGEAGRMQRQIEERGLEAASEAPTRSGYGRLDALGRGGNFLFAESLDQPQNYEPNTAPVSFPALWDTPYFDWVLYNNSVRQPLARSLVEALGVGAPIDLASLSRDGALAHDVRLDNLVEIQESLLSLRSPKWPEDILGPLDQGLVQDGEDVFARECAACHQRIERGAPRGPEVTFAIPSFEVDQIGTDPRQAVNFATREVTLNGTTQPLGFWVKQVTDAIVGQYVSDPDNAAAAEEINRGMSNDFQVIQEYRARPLNGIWATAPYLHNGSVPDLIELLKPPSERAKTFYVGRLEFDPERVGFEWKSPFPGAFRLDTRLPGNSNSGHDYGTELDAADKAALIEYLKSL